MRRLDVRTRLVHAAAHAAPDVATHDRVNRRRRIGIDDDGIRAQPAEHCGGRCRALDQQRSHDPYGDGGWRRVELGADGARPDVQPDVHDCRDVSISLCVTSRDDGNDYGAVATTGAGSGTLAVTDVPVPMADRIWSDPPIASRRSTMLTSPTPFCQAASVSNPVPLSATVRARPSRPPLRWIDNSVAPLCLIAFCRVSWATRNRHNITSDGSVEGTCSWVNAIGMVARDISTRSRSIASTSPSSRSRVGCS